MSKAVSNLDSAMAECLRIKAACLRIKAASIERPGSGRLAVLRARSMRIEATCLLAKSRQAVQAAMDFKYWIDIQAPGTVFHPSGKDVRETDAYKRAAELLDGAECALDCSQGCTRPRQMLFLGVPVCDVVPEDCTNAPAGTLDVLSKISCISRLKIIYQGSDSTKDRSLLDFGSCGHCFVGQFVEFFDDQERVVHFYSFRDGSDDLATKTEPLSQDERQREVAAGFVNRPAPSFPPESRFRAAVRSALLRLLDTASALSGSVPGKIRRCRRAVFHAFRERL